MASNLGELWKKGTTAPLADDIPEGGLAIDVQNQKAYSKSNGGAIFEIGGGAPEDHTHIIDDVDGLQAALDSKEPGLGAPDVDGKLLSSTAAGARSWITPPQGVTEHNLLTGRDAADAHPIDAITGLQTELDGKSDSSHNHDSTYVNVSGDVITGDLEVDGTTQAHGGLATGGYFSIHDFDDEINGRVRSHYRVGEIRFQGLDNSDIQVPTEMYVNGNIIWNEANMGSGSGLDSDLLDGHHADYFATGAEFDSHAGNTGNPHVVTAAQVGAYATSQFVDESLGTGDAGKPIVLDVNGRIDPSFLDTSTFYYVGPHDPSGGTEYPDETVETPGAFWVVDTLTAPNDGDGYIFAGGELAGKRITVGDFMVWGTGGWGIMAGEMNPMLYYKLDGTYALTAPFAAGGQQLQNIAAGSATGHAVEYDQFNAGLGGKAPTDHDHVIGDITGLQTELDLKLEQGDLDSALEIGVY